MISTKTLTTLIHIAGVGQICMMMVFLVAVPKILGWEETLKNMPRLHRQIHQAYSKYVIATGASLGLFSILFSNEISSGAGLGQAIALFTAGFWAIRLLLQKFYDIQPYLQTRWHVVGYHTLTVVFALLATLYLWAGLHGVIGYE